MTAEKQIPGGPACSEWESLLTDALDGLLNPEDEARFLEHKAACPACAGLYEEARKGREWLEFLSPEPEPPEGLFEKILAATGQGMQAEQEACGMPAAAGAVLAATPPGWMARMRLAVEPRLMMTAAMAFFSIALTLNLASGALQNLRLAQLRPQTVRSYVERQVSMASVPVVRYYDHLRFVYEVKEQVRALRSQNEKENGGLGARKPQPQNAPGESRRNRMRRPGSSPRLRVAGQPPPSPATTEPAIDAGDRLLESLLARPAWPMQSEESRLQRLGRSTPWIALITAA